MFKLEKISDWINKWENDFDSIIPDPSSIKTLVYLVLLERQNKWSTYKDILKELEDRGVIEQGIDNIDMSLRNGMNQIVKALERDHLYKSENTKNGRQARYRIKKRNQSGIKTNTSNDVEIVCNFAPDPTASMDNIAKRLMIDHRMPFYGIYLPMRAASRWVLYSEEEAEERRNYEGDQCERLLGGWFEKYRGQEISLIGLGIGEGIGEIELIERLLTDKYEFKRIHYCAIDTNIHLLLDHVERLRDKFKDEIRNKKLVCGVIRGNFLEDFSDLIQTLRQEFEKKGQFNDLASGFLPSNFGTLVSILGNLMGNLEHRASEWKYFQPILEELKGHDLAFLLGVSVQQKNENMHVIEEKYTRDLDDLLLATPKYLTHELGILKSHKSDEINEADEIDEAGEFFLPKNDNEKKKRCPSVHVEEYQGDYSVKAEQDQAAGVVVGKKHIKGSIYEFFYITQWKLSMELNKEILTVDKGTALLLYNIIKFDLETLTVFLESKPLRVLNNSITYKVDTANGKREYAVLAVTT